MLFDELCEVRQDTVVVRHCLGSQKDIRVYTCGSDERRAQTAALQTEFSYNHLMYKTQSGTTDL